MGTRTSEYYNNMLKPKRNHDFQFIRFCSYCLRTSDFNLIINMLAYTHTLINFSAHPLGYATKRFRYLTFDKYFTFGG